MSSDELRRLDDHELNLLLHERMDRMQADLKALALDLKEHRNEHREHGKARTRVLMWAASAVLAVAALIVSWVRPR